MKWLTPDLMVENVAQTIAFYRDVLGFELLRTFPEMGTPFWALLKKGNAEIMLQEKQHFAHEFSLPLPGKLGGSFALYMAVPEIDAFYASVKDSAKIVKELHGTAYGAQRFAVEDCNGYVLVFQDK